jgi:hypothetical protein
VNLFKERLIYEQSRTRTAREQQKKRPCGWSRLPLKIEQLRRDGYRCTPPGAAALHTLHYTVPVGI